MRVGMWRASPTLTQKSVVLCWLVSRTTTSAASSPARRNPAIRARLVAVHRINYDTPNASLTSCLTAVPITTFAHPLAAVHRPAPRRPHRKIQNTPPRVTFLQTRTPRADRPPHPWSPVTASTQENRTSHEPNTDGPTSRGAVSALLPPPARHTTDRTGQ
jgi:hypothetical protein